MFALPTGFLLLSSSNSTHGISVKRKTQPLLRTVQKCLLDWAYTRLLRSSLGMDLLHKTSTELNWKPLETIMIMIMI